jgi:hypothetical protein
MEDAEGRFIDFKNTLILLTTNVGTERIIDLCKDPELLSPPTVLPGLYGPRCLPPQNVFYL